MAQLTVDRSFFVNNNGTAFAGGISAMGRASVNIINSCSRIRGNARPNTTASSVRGGTDCYGVGLAVLDAAKMNVRSSVVSDNTGRSGCRGGGAAVYDYGQLTISGNSSLSNNQLVLKSTSPSDGGGVYVGGNASLEVSGGTRVVYNVADRGAGIFAATVRMFEFAVGGQ